MLVSTPLNYSQPNFNFNPTRFRVGQPAVGITFFKIDFFICSRISTISPSSALIRSYKPEGSRAWRVSFILKFQVSLMFPTGSGNVGYCGSLLPDLQIIIPPLSRQAPHPAGYPLCGGERRDRTFISSFMRTVLAGQCNKPIFTCSPIVALARLLVRTCIAAPPLVNLNAHPALISNSHPKVRSLVSSSIRQQSNNKGDA
jgi:hypothetical protein